ncbi:MAG: hypothetical protein ACREJF_07755 [Candidatus Methylomirabilales bacterium]
MLTCLRAWLCAWAEPQLVAALETAEQARLAALAWALVQEVRAKELEKEILAGAPGLGLAEYQRIERANARALVHIQGKTNGDQERTR